MQRAEQDALDLRIALGAARGQHVTTREPEPEPEPVNSVELALRLLLEVCGSHRIAARRHLRQLERQAAEEGQEAAG